MLWVCFLEPYYNGYVVSSSYIIMIGNNSECVGGKCIVPLNVTGIVPRSLKRVSRRPSGYTVGQGERGRGGRRVVGGRERWEGGRGMGRKGGVGRVGEEWESGV